MHKTVVGTITITIMAGSVALDYLEDDSEGTDEITKGNKFKSKEIPNVGI